LDWCRDVSVIDRYLVRLHIVLLFSERTGCGFARHLYVLYYTSKFI